MFLQTLVKIRWLEKDRSQHSRLLFYVVFSQPNRSVITIFCGKNHTTIKQKREVQVGCHERQSKRVINKHFRFNLPPFCFHFLRTKCRSYIYTYVYLLFLALLLLLPWLKFIEKWICFVFSLSPSLPPKHSWQTSVIVKRESN